KISFDFIRRQPVRTNRFTERQRKQAREVSTHSGTVHRPAIGIATKRRKETQKRLLISTRRFRRDPFAFVGDEESASSRRRLRLSAAAVRAGRGRWGGRRGGGGLSVRWVV